MDIQPIIRLSSSDIAPFQAIIFLVEMLEHKEVHFSRHVPLSTLQQLLEYT